MRPPLALHALVVLAALSVGIGCNNKDSDTGPFDADGDGVTAASDCDDDDPEVATPSRFYEDADGDGFGNAESAKIACGPSEGWVTDQTDCNDADPEAHPGAIEYCSGVGDDCDSDHSITEKADTVTLYPDWDGDGYGNPDDPTVVCPGTEGFLEDATDCDDTDELTNPGGTEICVDHKDQDCNGIVDGCDAPLASQPTANGAATGDLFGYAVAAAGDMTADGIGDIVVGAPGAGSGGAAYVFGGPIDGDLDASSDAIVLSGDANARFGASVSGGHDLDMDTADDLVVGAPGTSSSDIGAVYVFAGPIDADLSTADAAGAIVGSPGDKAGYTVVFSEDATNDGKWDILIGAPESDEGGTHSGAVYVWTGPVTGTVDLSESRAAIIGTAGSQAGSTVIMPRDVTGDGSADLAIAALGDDDEKGTIHILEGPFHGTLSFDDSIANLTGESACDRAGTSLTMAGDMNLDGYKDLVIGAPIDNPSCGVEDPGKAYVVYGPITESASLADAAVKIVGVDDQDHAGAAIANVRDDEGDGRTDFVIGAPGADDDAGRAYLLLGPLTGTVELAKAQLNYIGTAADDQAGFSAASAGDVNDDGRSDVIIGAPGAGGTGQAYLYFATTYW